MKHLFKKIADFIINGVELKPGYKYVVLVSNV